MAWPDIGLRGFGGSLSSVLGRACGARLLSGMQVHGCAHGCAARPPPPPPSPRPPPAPGPQLLCTTQLAQREFEVSQREAVVKGAEELAARYSAKEEAVWGLQVRGRGRRQQSQPARDVRSMGGTGGMRLHRGPHVALAPAWQLGVQKLCMQVSIRPVVCGPAGPFCGMATGQRAALPTYPS